MPSLCSIEALDAAGIDVVARAQRAVGIDEKLRHQEQRDAPGAGGRVRQAGEHEVDDVIGHVVIAIGNEDLRAAEAIGAVARALGARAQRADVGAGLRLGKLHGAGPFAGDQLAKIGCLELVAAMGVERLDRAEGEQRTQPEGHVGGAPDLRADGVDRHRQSLAAEILRSRHRIPAGFRPAPVGVRPARRGGHLVVGELDAVLVADPVERRQHVGGEPAGFLENSRGNVVVEVAVVTGLHGLFEAGAVLEGKHHVADRCAVGHGNTQWARAIGLLSSHETTGPSTPKRDRSGAGKTGVTS